MKHLTADKTGLTQMGQLGGNVVPHLRSSASIGG
jgi:hypothetical protein